MDSSDKVFAILGVAFLVMATVAIYCDNQEKIARMKLQQQQRQVTTQPATNN